MDDAGLVRDVERRGDLQGNVDGLADGQRAPADQVGERPAVEELHRDERPALVLADLVNRADVRVIQRGSGSRLAREAIERSARERQDIGQELERDVAAKLRVGGAIDHAHPAASELFEDLIVRDAFADHWPERHHVTPALA